MKKLRILSFNVRMDTYDVDGHKGGTGELNRQSKNRVRAVAEQILSFQPDIVGLQEDVNNWVNNISLGEGYTRYIPDTVHKAHTMEYCSVYIKNGIKVKHHGWNWLTSDGTNSTVALTYDGLISDGKMTSDELAALGHYEGTGLKKNGMPSPNSYSLASRLMNYVVLDIDGEDIIYVNTHLQHRGHNNGNYESKTDVEKLLFRLRFFERCAQMQMLQRLVGELMVEYGTDKVIMTADFNDAPNGLDYGTGWKNFYSTVTDSGWNDSGLIAKKTVVSDTWNSAFRVETQGQDYQAIDGNSGNGDRIDFCFVSDALKDKVAEYRVGDYEYTTSDGVHVYPSDHLPIITDLVI
ncbi:MAG: hypothetical protein IJY08_03455 [Clostridia bacterium]|nr:hypothetical protein [Clostridia bacterium]